MRRAQRQAQERLPPLPNEGRPLTGGILEPDGRNTSHRVNIRPSKWDDKFKPSQFWIGKIPNLERAQLIADAVKHYVGEPPFHFQDVVNLYPPITCMGRVPGTPEELSTQEMFRSYIAAIAKGVEFKPQRKDFINQVKGVIEMDTFPFPAPPEDDVEHDDGEDTAEFEGVEHDDGEDTSEIEMDENAVLALSMSSNGVRAAVRPGSVSFAGEFNNLSGDDSVQAFLPGFNVQPDDSESILRSKGQSLGSIPLSKSMDDCPASKDGEGYQEWFQAIDALPSSLAATSDAEVDQESSQLGLTPILMITLSSSIFEPPFASVAPEDRADTALGSPEDCQLARNAKRLKIAGRNHID